MEDPKKIMSDRVRDLLTSERSGASLAGEVSRLAEAAEEIVEELKKKREREETEKEFHIVTQPDVGGPLVDGIPDHRPLATILTEMGGTVVAFGSDGKNQTWTIQITKKKAKTAVEDVTAKK